MYPKFLAQRAEICTMFWSDKLLIQWNCEALITDVFPSSCYSLKGFIDLHSWHKKIVRCDSPTMFVATRDIPNANDFWFRDSRKLGDLLGGQRVVIYFLQPPSVTSIVDAFWRTELQLAILIGELGLGKLISRQAHRFKIARYIVFSIKDQPVLFATNNNLAVCCF